MEEGNPNRCEALMAEAPSRRLSELLAAAEKRKYDAIRERLRIPSDLKIDGLQLDSLSYHLTERSGRVYLKLEGDRLQVGESEQQAGLTYRGDAILFLLNAWGITEEEARRGFSLSVRNGQREG